MTEDRVHVLRHASELLTGAGVREKDGRRPTETDLGRIEDGAMAYSVKTVPYIDFTTGKRGQKVVADRILWVGKSDALPAEYAESPIFDLDGKNAVIPGLVDCHTHLVFAGDRGGEFAARCGGATYAEIAAAGGGIQTTVRATRAASEEELFRLGRARLEEAHRYGVRTLELIMTAPMVVASWINLQYYGSTVNNAAFGAGDKVLHNVVGTLGVLEGNAGDLKAGLPMQSVHDGRRFVHEPLRLTVVIAAPTEAIDAVIAKHSGVRELVDNGWLHPFACDDTGVITRRARGEARWSAP